MGTRWSLHCVSAVPVDTLRADIGTLLASIVSEMSNWEADSDISRFNRAPAGSWHSLPAQFHEVLETALSIARESEGAFDPTVGPLVDLWGFGPSREPGRVPDRAAIATAASEAAWSRISSDRAARRAFQPGGAELDFSGIAKGYAVDRIGRFLDAKGIRHFLAEIGGELLGRGIKPDGQPWWVDLELPPGCTVAPVRIALHSLAAATSGNYRRFFRQSGHIFSHTIDPRTSSPIDNGIASVTVLHESCMIADAYATAISVMGPDKGLAFASARNVAVHIIVEKDGGWEEIPSPAFAAMLD